MSHFNRLTDIVTCNLTSLLEGVPDQQETLREIIHEMEEGQKGAQRSVRTANIQLSELEQEIVDHRQMIEYWQEKTRSLLASDSDAEARAALVRRRETEDLLAGLETQHQAAKSTVQQLQTTSRALDARLADARRRLMELSGHATAQGHSASGIPDATQLETERDAEIEEELQRMKRELEEG